MKKDPLWGQVNAIESLDYGNTCHWQKNCIVYQLQYRQTQSFYKKKTLYMSLEKAKWTSKSLRRVWKCRNPIKNCDFYWGMYYRYPQTYLYHIILYLSICRSIYLPTWYLPIYLFIYIYTNYIIKYISMYIYISDEHVNTSWPWDLPRWSWPWESEHLPGTAAAGWFGDGPSSDWPSLRHIPHRFLPLGTAETYPQSSQNVSPF